LLFDILPYVARVLFRRASFGFHVYPQVMRPGKALDCSRIPATLIPYDIIYARRRSKTPAQPATSSIESEEDVAK
jgi:hypothetical protein